VEALGSWYFWHIFVWVDRGKWWWLLPLPAWCCGRSTANYLLFVNLSPLRSFQIKKTTIVYSCRWRDVLINLKLCVADVAGWWRYCKTNIQGSCLKEEKKERLLNVEPRFDRELLKFINLAFLMHYSTLYPCCITYFYLYTYINILGLLHSALVMFVHVELLYCLQPTWVYVLF